MKNQQPYSLLAVLSISAALLWSNTPTGAATPQPNANSDFIQTGCKSTQYPDLCHALLSGFAKEIQHDYAKLAVAAVRLTHSNVKELAGYLADVNRRPQPPATAGALRDCVDSFGDAADLIKQSMDQIEHLSPGAAKRQFELNSVQTWMSSAMTGQDTCVEGFKSVNDSPAVKKDVEDRVGKVEPITSIALALVNLYTSKLPAA